MTIIYVGPAATVPGGISSLQEKIVSHLPPNIRVAAISTCSAYTGYDRSYRLSVTQLVVFLRALVEVFYFAVMYRHAIFHVHLAKGGSTLRKGIVCVLLRALGCPYVVHAHADAAFHGWVPIAVKRTFWWGIEGASYVITLTQQWRDFYSSNLRIPLSKLLVLPNPAVLPAISSRRGGRNETNILFLGRIGERKGTFDLIQAFAALPDDIRASCHLTIAGDGDLNAALSLAERLNCSKQVSILGWVNRQKVEALLQEANVLALPSHMEGMAMALLEAMAAGLAIVTSSAGGTSEFLAADHDCIFVTPGDVRGITYALTRLARDPDLTERLGTEARTTATSFRIENYIAKLTFLYQEMASETPNRARIQTAFTSK
jgi:glycosyltransferase involved in cell wall biosynthesis